MPIRKMEIEDIPAVIAIQNELRFQEWNEKQFAAEIRANYSFCIVYESCKNDCNNKSYSEILGYAIFHILGPDSELLSIATCSNHQQKGIGQKILDAGFAQLNFTEGDCCFLEVREGNIKARRFYEKNGFKECGERKRYYADGENAILYCKKN